MNPVDEMIKVKKQIERLSDKAFGKGTITEEQYNKRVRPLAKKLKELQNLINN